MSTRVKPHLLDRSDPHRPKVMVGIDPSGLEGRMSPSVEDTLVYSDLHCRLERLQDCDRVLAGIDALLMERGTKTVVNLGDTFNTRGLVPTRCLDLLYYYYQRWSEAGIQQIILVGNHDQEDQGGTMHPFRVFGALPGVKVIDQPTLVREFGALRNVYFFPYMAEVTEYHIAEAQRTGAKVLFAHWGIRGARRNDANVDAEGVPLEWLRGFTQVYSGHYHLPQEFGNVLYVGSPMEQDFGEAGQQKGVLLLDGMRPWLSRRVVLADRFGTRRHLTLRVKVDDGGELEAEAVGLLQTQVSLQARNVLGRGDDALRFDLSGPAAALATVTTDRLKGLFVRVDGGFPGAHNAEEFFQRTVILIDRTADGTAGTSRLGIEVKDIHATETLLARYVAHLDPALDHAELLRVGKDLLAG